MTIDKNGYGYDFETGKPGPGTLGQAVQCWSVMVMNEKNKQPTVADAAAAFHCSETDILEACEHNPLIYIFGPHDDFSKMIIDHDGE